MNEEVTRRDVLKTAAAGGAMFVASGLAAQVTTQPATQPATRPAVAWPGLPPVRIFKLYAGRTGDAYLTRPTEEINRLEAHFAQIEKKLGDVQFVGGDMIPPGKPAEVAEKLKDADALLIIHLSGHGGDAPVLTKLVDVGLPTVVFSQPFSGHGWMYFPPWRKQGKKVVLLPTSDWSELERVAGLLRAPVWMKQTRVLVLGRPHGTAPACSAEMARQKLGVEYITLTKERVQEVMNSIDPKDAEAEADEYWIRPARRIVEPKRDEIIYSTRYFLAIQQIMKQENAQAIASSLCMGNPRGCLTFSKLNDMGLVGACEGDMDSTLTMLIFAYAFRKPGFISDPVIDTAKNAMVHFHCTCSTRMDGPGSPRLPFSIRTQTDTRGGVALEVENRVGAPVTCAKLVDLDKMLVVTGKITGTSTSPLACRTQFTQSVPDARRLFLNWGADVIKGSVMTLLHRVVFYGDHRNALEDIGDLMGFKVIEEGGAAV